MLHMCLTCRQAHTSYLLGLHDTRWNSQEGEIFSIHFHVSSREREAAVHILCPQLYASCQYGGWHAYTMFSAALLVLVDGVLVAGHPSGRRRQVFPHLTFPRSMSSYTYVSPHSTSVIKERNVGRRLRAVSIIKHVPTSMATTCIPDSSRIDLSSVI